MPITNKNFILSGNLKMNTLTLEADTRVSIDKRLENLGWTFRGKGRNVYLEQPKTQKEKKLLGGKCPDYVLYAKDEHGDERPIMVIEAKRKGERVDTALEQGIQYAKVLDAPIVFATDGLFCKSYHTRFDRTPILNGEEVDEFLRETLAIKYLVTWEVNTVSPKVQYDRKELIKIFDEANNMLRGDGLRAGIERFGEFANILFLKLVSENEQIKHDAGKESGFDFACHWNSIKNISASARIEYINSTVCPRLNALYGTEIFTPLTIRSNTILKEIIDKLDPLTLTDVDSDVKGDAFEYFLKESASTKNDLGEYFTPRHIVKTMVKLANPQIGEKVYDPFCGTGGFLIESFRHIWNTMTRTEENETRLRVQTIYGNEITNTARITKMNMILAGDGHSNIHMRDSLANPIDGTEEYDEEQPNGKTEKKHRGYDVVITNMPYSQRTKHGNLYDLPSNNGDSICVQHCMKAINSASENGRIALVVPEGFLFRKDLSKTRELLLKNCDLQSVISLPQGVFLPYTGVKTNILYATKVNQKLKASQKRKDFWYFEVKSDGYTLDNHRRKLDSGNDLDKYQEYRKLDKIDDKIDDKRRKEMLNVGFEIIPLDKVKENALILVGSRYREAQKETYKHESQKLSEISTFIRGISFPKSAQIGRAENAIGVVTTRAAQITGIVDDDVIFVDTSYTKEDKFLQEGDILISLANSLNLVGRTTYVDRQHEGLTFGAFMGTIRANKRKILPKLLYHLLNSEVAKRFFEVNAKTTTNISNLTFDDLGELVLPIPPLKLQRLIVDELDRYQRIIDGARVVVESYEPQIYINSNWTRQKIGDICELATGSTPSTQDRDNYDSGTIRWLVSGDIHKGIIYDCDGRITEKGRQSANLKMHKKNSVLIALNGQGKTRGTVALLKIETTSNQSLVAMFPKTSEITADFLYYVLKGMYQEIRNITGDMHRSGLNMILIRDIYVPVPDIDTQKKVVAQIEAEQALIEPSKQLIEVFTKKIQNRINEIWGE
jgi:type I restriction enzyme M protein